MGRVRWNMWLSGSLMDLMPLSKEKVEAREGWEEGVGRKMGWEGGGVHWNMWLSGSLMDLMPQSKY